MCFRSVFFVEGILSFVDTSNIYWQQPVAFFLTGEEEKTKEEYNTTPD